MSTVKFNEFMQKLVGGRCKYTAETDRCRKSRGKEVDARCKVSAKDRCVKSHKGKVASRAARKEMSAMRKMMLNATPASAKKRSTPRIVMVVKEKQDGGRCKYAAETDRCRKSRGKEVDVRCKVSKKDRCAKSHKAKVASRASRKEMSAMRKMMLNATPSSKKSASASAKKAKSPSRMTTKERKKLRATIRKHSAKKSSSSAKYLSARSGSKKSTNGWSTHSNVVIATPRRS